MKGFFATKIFKAIIISLASVIVVGSTGAAAWAIAKHYNKYNSDFDIVLSGDRYVEATITGSSYLEDSSTPYETLTPVSFNKNSETEEATLSFKKPLTIKNNEKVSKLKFEIKNNSTINTHSDLIIKPSITTTNIEDVILSWHYSIDGEQYNAYIDNYLVIHKNTSITLELHILATTEMYGESSLSDTVSIDLYSEKEAPTDFSYDYSYDVEYIEEGSNGYFIPYKTSHCPTCKMAKERTKMQSNEYEFAFGSPYTENIYTENIKNKTLLFHDTCYTGGEIIFTGGLENVILARTDCSYDIEGMRFITTINEQGECEQEYKNIKLVDLYFVDNIYFEIQEGETIPAYNTSVQLNCSNISFEGCIFSDMDSVFRFSYSASLNNLNWSTATIDEFHFIDNSFQAVNLILNVVKNVVISNNTFTNSVLHIISLTNNLYIADNDLYAIAIQNAANANIKIINNQDSNNAHSSNDFIIIHAATNSTMSIYKNIDMGYYYRPYKIEKDTVIDNPLQVEKIA